MNIRVLQYSWRYSDPLAHPTPILNLVCQSNVDHAPTVQNEDQGLFWGQKLKKLEDQGLGYGWQIKVHTRGMKY
jgi:hypothetical protein